MLDTSNDIKVEAQNALGAFALIASSPNRGKLYTFKAINYSVHRIDKSKTYELSIFTGMIVSIKSNESDPTLFEVRYINPGSTYCEIFLTDMSISELESLINSNKST
ncbi:hypothetical protein [Acinetobacter nosocomialis]|uniref:hypothetical protein n=1 Tax=Acinetobacter nosocomialis TaxID=106654 RepID=UPI0029D88700|nr:hypothetical protein [Acinetobacter nosocomialis]MDX7882117.1 hypothetical protein [Acinetobacter nosocomialis]